MSKRKIRSNLLVIIILFVIMILSNIFISQVLAEDDIISGLGGLNEYKAGSSGTSSSFTSKVNNVVGVFRLVGSIVSVMALVALGIKYMFGSVEERAEYKETMKPYIIGAVLVFGISNVTSILYDIGSEIFW